MAEQAEAVKLYIISLQRIAQMPRRTRMYLPGIPAHIVQRGNNRNACFFRDDDYRYYLDVLAEGMKRYGASLHAYCLMTNHVHLLMTPSAEDSLSRVIQHLGGQYVQYVNKTYHRSGTLWEGRHKGSMVDADRYLLTCYRYIELNPVAAAMVKKPEQYQWSSYHTNGAGNQDDLISPHPVYTNLGATMKDRCYAYRELFREKLTDGGVHELKSCLSSNYILGDQRFYDEVEQGLCSEFCVISLSYAKKR